MQSGRTEIFNLRSGGGGGGGTCFHFHSGRGGGDPPPWTRSPPPPSGQVHLKTWVLGTFFGHGQRMPYTVYVLLHLCSIYLVLQTTMPQRSLSVYFSSPFQPSPRTKREDVIDALLYFTFKDRTDNEAQKVCATIFLRVPMATLCEFVVVAQKKWPHATAKCVACRMNFMRCRQLFVRE